MSPCKDAPQRGIDGCACFLMTDFEGLEVLIVTVGPGVSESHRRLSHGVFHTRVHNRRHLSYTSLSLLIRFYLFQSQSILFSPSPTPVYNFMYSSSVSSRHGSFLSTGVREYACSGLYSIADPGVEKAQPLIYLWGKLLGNSRVP